jgi:tRNA (guanine-N7-)-methyltransferase
LDQTSINVSGDSTRTPAAPDEILLRGPWPKTPFFEREAPLEVELGTGKARFLIEWARLHPERNVLGLERNLSYYRMARERVAKAGLPNARVIRADARPIFDTAAPGSVAGFHAYFLDPWPKQKQRKRRLLDATYLGTLARSARPGALLRVVTDHAEYADAIRLAVGQARSAGAPWEPRPWESEESPPPTHYEIKYRADGRTFHRFLLVRA